MRRSVFLRSSFSRQGVGHFLRFLCKQQGEATLSSYAFKLLFKSLKLFFFQ